MYKSEHFKASNPWPSDEEDDNLCKIIKERPLRVTIVMVSHRTSHTIFLVTSFSVRGPMQAMRPKWLGAWSLELTH